MKYRVKSKKNITETKKHLSVGKLHTERISEITTKGKNLNR